MCNNNNSGCECISEILNVINILQNNAECTENCLDTCDRGFLGCGNTSIGCNTRPIMLFTCCGNGTPWSMPTSKEPISCNNEEDRRCSDVFRIEKIDGCCGTFRVLAENPNREERNNIPFVATNSFFTMNLNCICVIKCLQDTFVECI